MIYAIGTSHTYGMCRGIENGVLEKTWCDVLQERVQMPVINYGRSGVNNLQLIEMAEYICKNDNPDLIIAELRWTTHPLMYEKHKAQKANVDLFAKTRYNGGGDTDKYGEMYREIHYGWAKHVEYIEKRFPEFTSSLSEQELQDVKGWIKVSFLHNIMEDHYKRQALSNFYHLQSICDNHNVPLKIFVWTASNYADLSDSKFDMSGLSTFGFFKDGKTFIEHAGDWTQQHRCECEHFKLPVHEHLVDIIEQEVLEVLNKYNISKGENHEQ